MGLLLAMFIVFFLYVNFGKPFGSVFSYLINKFNILLVFRYSGSSFYYILYFIFGTLFGIGSAYILDSLQKRKKAVLAMLFAALVVAMLAVRVYYFDYLPAADYKGITIPQYVFDVSNYINSQSGNFNVGLLPAELPFMHYGTWYTGTDVYTYFINNPSFTGGYIASSQIFFPPSQYEYFAVAQRVQTVNVSSSFAPYGFGLLGIRYIVIQNDTLNAGDNVFNLTTLYKNLGNSTGISLMQKFTNTTVYYNSKAVDLVYPANVAVLNSSINYPQMALNASSYNISRTAFYINSSFAQFNSSGKLVYNITGFGKPSVSYKVVTPTKTLVHISNSTKPFYLVFSETYDPEWAAYYSNGNAISSEDHIAVNFYANAWYVNKTGNFTVTLYYKPQTMAWISWIISFIGVGIAGFVGYSAWKEKRMR